MKGSEFIEEFRKFIDRGNALDLAVAVIVGGAFKAIVDSIVADIITPLLGIFLGGVNFSSLSLTLGHAHIRYGAFIQASINFLIISLVVFFIVKNISRVKEKFGSP